MKNLKYLKGERITVKDTTEKESTRGCPRLEKLLRYEVFFFLTPLDVLLTSFAEKPKDVNVGETIVLGV